ncbi:hypothetical protein LMK04_04145 [Lactococcus petauri]|jgi:hypothetical protein|nr:hypothetical protein LMK04_04145 [Lactococcus petauri]
MGYQTKFTQLQKSFLGTASMFYDLTYRDLTKIWSYAGGKTKKPPSSLLKKAEQLNILTLSTDDADKKTKYNFNSKKLNGYFEVNIRPKSTFEEHFEEHDQYLRKLALEVLEYFTGYQLEFPVNRTFKNHVPDLIFSKTNHSMIVEFDNLTEKRFDFVSKFPRYIDDFEEVPKGEFIDLIFVFKGAPVQKMTNFLETVSHIKTYDGKSLLEWLTLYPNINIYYISEWSWSLLSRALVQKTNAVDVPLVLEYAKALHYYNIKYYLKLLTLEERRLAFENIVYSDIESLPQLDIMYPSRADPSLSLNSKTVGKLLRGSDTSSVKEDIPSNPDSPEPPPSVSLFM